MRVFFKDGRTVDFNANGWDFTEVELNNVLLNKDGECIAHLNWKEVLYIVDEGINK